MSEELNELRRKAKELIDLDTRSVAEYVPVWNEYIQAASPSFVLALLSRLEQAEQAVARVRELHPMRFYDKWGRDSSEPLGRGGWCSICGRFDGDACRTIRALDGDGRG